MLSIYFSREKGKTSLKFTVQQYQIVMRLAVIFSYLPISAFRLLFRDVIGLQG